MAKVSIIVPIYNTSKYLNGCIKSLLHQTLEDIEIILINDGSTDESESIIKKYKDKRIKYISKKNEGIGKTRNLGIDTATGEYLSFIDSDDYIEPNFCEVMYEKAIKDKCDIVICDYYEDHNYGLKEIRFPTFKDASLKENPDILNMVNLGPCNKIYKRSLFKNKENRFVENLKYEDAPLVVKLLLNAKKIGKIDDCLAHYVIHENSETTTRDERIFDIIKITDIMVNDLKKHDYLRDAMINIAVMVLTDYTIQQRYINDSELRNKFIDMVFQYLDELDSNWKKCSYLKKFSWLKRKVKSSKILTKVYCAMYNKKKGEK
mgnify:FL=1